MAPTPWNWSTVLPAKFKIDLTLPQTSFRVVCDFQLREIDRKSVSGLFFQLQCFKVTTLGMHQMRVCFDLTIWWRGDWTSAWDVWISDQRPVVRTRAFWKTSRIFFLSPDADPKVQKYLGSSGSPDTRTPSPVYVHHWSDSHREVWSRGFGR